MYTLSQKTIATIDTLKPGIISKLALSLECSDSSINRYIRDNEPNGDLTKYAALEVLQQETGFAITKLLQRVGKNEVAKKLSAA